MRYSKAINGWRHYYPFGEEITSTVGDTYKFAQLYRDADTGLDYAMARYHSSTIARFLSVDSGGTDPANPQLWNRYAYSLNDPINYGDPSGLDPCFFGGDFCVTVTGPPFNDPFTSWWMRQMYNQPDSPPPTAVPGPPPRPPPREILGNSLRTRCKRRRLLSTIQSAAVSLIRTQRGSTSAPRRC